MAIVHEVYRREFALAPRILRDLRPHETARRAAAADWFGVTILAMHHHHQAEDALIYPLLVDTAPPELLELMHQQHRAVDAGVQAVEHALAAWRAGRPGSTDVLARRYEQLLPVVVQHLDDEERDVVPLIAASLTAEQYGRMATSGNDLYEPKVLLLCFGAMIEDCSTEDAKYMLSHLPAHVRESWYGHARQEYGELMTLLRGELTVVARTTATTATSAR